MDKAAIDKIAEYDTPELMELKTRLLSQLFSQTAEFDGVQRYFVLTDIARALIVHAHLPVLEMGGKGEVDAWLQRYCQTIPELADHIASMMNQSTH